MKNTAIGCGAAVLLVGGLILVMTFSIIGPLRHAAAARETLDERFGAQDQFTPPADGVIAAERLETFIQVRQDMAEACAGLTKAEEEILKIEAFDEQEEVSKVEVMGQALRTSRAAMGMGSLISELYEARNAGLLEHEMGLGEFSYIYAIVYREELQVEPPPNAVFGGPRFNRRVRGLLGEMLVRQRELAVSEAPVLLEELDAEIAALQEDGRRLPWQDGLPDELAASLEPHRQALQDVYCPTTASIELLLNKRRGLAYGSY